MADAKTATIQGVEFPVSQPYDEGHVLTAPEAATLNQVRKENLSNQFRAKVKAHVNGEEGALDADALQAEFVKLDAAYTFTIASVASTAKLSPVEREAQNLAKQFIKSKLAEKNRKLTDVPAGDTEESWADKLAAKIAEIAALPEIVKQAEKNIKEREKLAKMELGELGLDSVEA